MKQSLLWCTLVLVTSTCIIFVVYLSHTNRRLILKRGNSGNPATAVFFTGGAKMSDEVHSPNLSKAFGVKFPRSAQSVDSHESVLKRFDERRSLVRSNCKKLGLWKRPLTKTEQAVLEYNMIVDDRHHLLYCYLPKAACTSWKKVFQVLTGQAKSTSSISGKSAHNRSQLRFLRDLKQPDKIQKRLATYKKLMVHREPMTRFVSAYMSKFVRPDKYFVKKFGTNIIAKYRKNATRESLVTGIGVRFEEFSQYIIDSSSHSRALLFDGHWRPAVFQCFPCSVDYDFISFLDTADADAAAILKSVAASERVTFPHDNIGNYESDVRKYYSRLNWSVVQKLISIYKLDFTLLGYKIPNVTDLVYL